MIAPRHQPDRRRFARQLIVAGVAGVALACGEPSQAGSDARAPQDPAPAPTPMLVIDHLAPRPDFVGAQPQRFAWSAVPGADAYAVGVWSEADRLMWRQDGLTGTTVEWPKDYPLDAGTYFWSVAGVKQGREIANSGRAAFVVD